MLISPFLTHLAMFNSRLHIAIHTFGGGNIDFQIQQVILFSIEIKKVPLFPSCVPRKSFSNHILRLQVTD